MYSLKTRIMLLFSIVMIVFVASLTVVVQNYIINQTTNNQIAKTRQELNCAVDKIKESWLNSKSHYATLLTGRKKLLKNVTTLAFDIIEETRQDYLNGKITQEQAKKYALKQIKKLRFLNGTGYFWIQDCQKPIPYMLMHPVVPQLDGHLSNDKLCYEALNNGKNLNAEFVRICQEKKDAEAFVPYIWPKPTANGLSKSANKIAFVKIYKSWEWLIGTGLYIDDIENEFAKQIKKDRNRIFKELKKIRLAQNGYIFIFDKNSNFLLHPVYNKNIKKFTRDKQRIRNVQQQIINCAEKNKDGKVFYRWSRPNHPNEYNYEKVGFLSYFKPFGWYICTSVYKEDLQLPALSLRKKIFEMAGIFLFIGLIIAWMVANSIAKPISLIAKTSNQIVRDGISEINLKIKGPTEIEILAFNLKKMILSLDKPHQYIANILDSIGEGVLAVDTNGKIARMNPTAEKITKWDFKEAKGSSLTQVFSTRRKPKLSSKKIEENLINNENQRILIAKDGSECYISLSESEIKSSGDNISGRVIIFRDITNELKLTERLGHSQKLEAVGQLAGGIAHDFNNMLGGILGSAELLASKLPKEDAKQKYVSMIANSAGRASELASKLLSFSRKQAIVFSTLDISCVIEDLLDIIRNTADKRININTEIKAGNTWISGEYSELQNLFLNVLINATHAMPDGGNIDISIRNIDAKQQAGDSFHGELNSDIPYLEVKIRDNGCGMSKELMSRIFEPFFSTREKDKGTGLGLASAHGIVKQHKGIILVESKIGEGSCFTVLLPSLTKEKKLKDKPKPKSSRKKKTTGTILVIDDEEVMRLTIYETLKSTGYTVFLANNGEEGVAIYRDQADNIDLVLCDMVMPKMNGSDCFFTLKEINNQIKFIVISGYTDGKDVNKMKENGLLGFIKKPFSGKDIINAVSQAINS